MRAIRRNLFADRHPAAVALFALALVLLLIAFAARALGYPI